jgi:hypothetical protein
MPVRFAVLMYAGPSYRLFFAGHEQAFLLSDVIIIVNCNNYLVFLIST